MIAKPIALLMSDLGVTKSHSRPRVPDDNPYSEAQFRTLKYRPDYPERFGSLQDARQWAQRFFIWYNQQHHHTGLSLLTPADVHYDRAEEKLAYRQVVLQQAYQLHPERFVRGEPTPTQLPDAVWINQPGTPSTDGTTDITLNQSPQSTILPVAGTEDRALLGSNPSADTGERCNPGQGPALCPGPTATRLHCSGKR